MLFRSLLFCLNDGVCCLLQTDSARQSLATFLYFLFILLFTPPS